MDKNSIHNQLILEFSKKVHDQSLLLGMTGPEPYIWMMQMCNRILASAILTLNAALKKEDEDFIKLLIDESMKSTTVLIDIGLKTVGSTH